MHKPLTVPQEFVTQHCTQSTFYYTKPYIFTTPNLHLSTLLLPLDLCSNVLCTQLGTIQKFVFASSSSTTSSRGLFTHAHFPSATHHSWLPELGSAIFKGPSTTFRLMYAPNCLAKSWPHTELQSHSPSPRPSPQSHFVRCQLKAAITRICCQSVWLNDLHSGC